MKKGSALQVNILLDRSGSMDSLWTEAINSINAYVDQLDPKTKINLAVFDNQYEVIRNCLVKDWSPLTVDTVRPRGLTALYDSIMRSIETAKSINADKTVLVVMTDGFENASKSTSLNTVKTALTAFRDRGWEDVFLGANFDKINLVGASMGVPLHKMADYTKDTMVMNMANLGTRTMSYAATGASLSAT